MDDAEERTPHWIKWVVGGSPEWVAMGPEGEIGGFDDRIECLTATAEAMGLTLDYVDMGSTFNDMPDGNYWMTVKARNKPRPGPPYIPPTLDWQINGLLQEGAPVVDTAMSAQHGYRGTVLDRAGSFRVCWEIPEHHAEDEAEAKFRYMITSITGGSGLDLSKRPGRNRAIDWLCDRLNLTNLMPTSAVFGAAGNDRWRLNVFPDTTINFDAAPGHEEHDVVATFIVPALAEVGNPEETFDDGTFVFDARAIKAIVEWVYDNPREVFDALHPHGVA